MVRYAPILFLLLLSSPDSSAADAQPSAEKLVEMVMPTIVAIRAETPDGVSAGTGFIVESSGVIVTNLHVIEGARRVVVKLHSGEQYSKVMVASYDEGRDLAVIQIPGVDLPSLNLGNSDDVKVGATAYAIGNPLGLEESVTKGIVSSVRVGDDGTKIIQTNTAVSPGNSGGPLVNEEGEVIGIVTFKRRRGENLNFAMPVNYARALLEFETLMSLDELSKELGKQEVSLFSEADAESEDSLTGTWFSLSDITERELTQRGEYLYGSYNLDDRAEDVVRNGTLDLKRDGPDYYKGNSTSNWNCAWGSIANYCSTVHKVELRVVTPNRVEGAVESARYHSGWSKQEYRKWCESCGSALPQVWLDFVWIRKD